jgi:hypothetical protein
MNIPVDPLCQHCEEPYEGTFIIGATHVKWNCKKCGELNVATLPLDMTMGVQVWIKASHELTQNKDASMAVILSAAAIDCELTHLFKKWTGIAELAQRGHLLTGEECEDLLRSKNITNISTKFVQIPKLLVPEGFQHYVTATEKWRDVVSEDLPELDVSSLIEGIKKKVFWPRNSILHGGTPATGQQAELAVRIARGCLRIFLSMDYEKRKTLPRFMSPEPD